MQRRRVPIPFQVAAASRTWWKHRRESGEWLVAWEEVDGLQLKVARKKKIKKRE
jgi:hypothetical protein